MTIEDLKPNSTRTTTTVKRFILRHNLIPYNCVFCHNNGQWLDKPLILQLDHINGMNTDHGLTNLRFICPNCHSQTETYGRTVR